MTPLQYQHARRETIPVQVSKGLVAVMTDDAQSEMELIGSNIIGSGRIPDVVRYNSMRFDPIRQMGLYLDQE